MAEIHENDEMLGPESETVENFKELPGDEVLEDVVAEKKNIALVNAAAKGDVQEVSRLLSEGADVSYVDEYGESVLHIATRKGHVEVVQALIAAGALLSLDESDICTPLHLAAGNGCMEVLEALIKAGAFLEARDYDDETPLHYAARAGHADCVLALASAGADLEAMETRDFYTPLHMAVIYGHVHCVRTLISAGANVNSGTDFVAGPLHFVENPNIVILLAHGKANVNARDWDGCTALHQVVAGGSIGCVHALLSVGADPTIRDGEGKTPLDIAKDVAIKALLRDWLY